MGAEHSVIPAECHPATILAGLPSSRLSESATGCGSPNGSIQGADSVSGAIRLDGQESHRLGIKRHLRILKMSPFSFPQVALLVSLLFMRWRGRDIRAGIPSKELSPQRIGTVICQSI